MAASSGAPTDEERWARAEAILADDPGPTDEQVGRRSRVAARLRGLAGAVVAGGLVVLAFLSQRTGDPDAPRAQTAAGWVLQICGIVVLLVGGAVQTRAGLWRGRWRKWATSLSREQRRDLLRQVLGRAPGEPERVVLCRDLAAGLMDQRGPLLVPLGILCILMGQALVHPVWGRLALFAADLVGCAVLVLVQTRRSRAARRFLEQHPGVAEWRT